MRGGAAVSATVVAVGAALRLVQWLGNSSLWLDELMLVKSVRGRALGALLFHGLDDNQVAPAGYLFLTKLTTLAFGDGERALRLVPLGAALIALVMFARLARSFLGPYGGLAATVAFALSPMLISLGGVVKPYSTDVLATVLILFAIPTLSREDGSSGARVAVGAAAGAVGFLSIPSVLVATGALAALWGRAWATGATRNRDRRFTTLAPLVAWALLAGVAAQSARAVLTPQTERFMAAYWSDAGAFAPSFLEYPTWALERWRQELQAGLLFAGYAGPAGTLGATLGRLTGLASLSLLALISLVALVRRGAGLATVVVLPFLLALVLSRLGTYPMDARTWAFLLPLLFLGAGAVVSLAVSVVPRSVAWGWWLVTAVAAALPVAVLVDRPPLYLVQQEREIFSELARRRTAGEPVFVDIWAEPALSYYGERFGIGEPVRYGEDVGVLRGFLEERTLWLLFGHSNARRDYLLCYMDQVGRETDRIVLPGGIPGNPVSLHHYDLRAESPGGGSAVDDFPPFATAFDGAPPRCQLRDWSVADP